MLEEWRNLMRAIFRLHLAQVHPATGFPHAMLLHHRFHRRYRTLVACVINDDDLVRNALAIF